MLCWVVPSDSKDVHGELELELDLDLGSVVSDPGPELGIKSNGVDDRISNQWGVYIDHLSERG